MPIFKRFWGSSDKKLSPQEELVAAIESGDAQKVKTLIENRSVDVVTPYADPINTETATPSDIALSISGDSNVENSSIIEILDLLISKQPKPMDYDKFFRRIDQTITKRPSLVNDLIDKYPLKEFIKQHPSLLIDLMGHSRMAYLNHLELRKISKFRDKNLNVLLSQDHGAAFNAYILSFLNKLLVSGMYENRKQAEGEIFRFLKKNNPRMEEVDLRSTIQMLQIFFAYGFKDASISTTEYDTEKDYATDPNIHSNEFNYGYLIEHAIKDNNFAIQQEFKTWMGKELDANNDAAEFMAYLVLPAILTNPKKILEDLNKALSDDVIMHIKNNLTSNLAVLEIKQFFPRVNDAELQKIATIIEERVKAMDPTTHQAILDRYSFVVTPAQQDAKKVMADRLFTRIMQAFKKEKLISKEDLSNPIGGVPFKQAFIELLSEFNLDVFEKNGAIPEIDYYAKKLANHLILIDKNPAAPKPLTPVTFKLAAKSILSEAIEKLADSEKRTKPRG